MGKNQNTMEKRRREMEKKLRAEEKRKRKLVKKEEGPGTEESKVYTPQDMMG